MSAAIDLSGVLHALSDASEASGVAGAFDAEAARSDIMAALAMFKRLQRSEPPLDGGQRRARSKAFDDLAKHLRRAEGTLRAILETEGFAEPLVDAWSHARGYGVEAAEVSEAGRKMLQELGGWAAASDAAHGFATAPRGKAAGSDLQTLIGVLAGLYRHHAGEEPSPNPAAGTEDIAFVDFIQAVLATLPDLKTYEPAGIVTALRTVKDRSDWPDALAWMPPARGPSV